MLPPVISVPSSQISYQEQRPLIEIAGGNQANAAAAQTVVPSTLEQSSVAGRLNMLLLLGRERMAENLAMLADIFGTAIGVTRKEGESSLAFVMRLAEAIAALPLSERVKLEGQLARVLSGVQLRMLLAALRNPAGADAAKLSMLIELARNTERDLAARSVVTSYRQNAAEPRGEPSVAPNAAKLATPAASAALVQPTANEQPAAVSALPASAPDMPDSLSNVAPQTVVGDGAASAQPDRANPTALQRALSPDHVPDGPDDGTTAHQDVVSTPQSTVPGADAADRGDAHGLQVLLQRSFAAGLPAAANAAAAPERGEQVPFAIAGEIATETVEPAEVKPQIDALEMEEYSPVSELRRGPDTAKAMDRPQTTLLVLKGWREVNNLVSLAPDLAAQAPGRGLLAQALQAAGGGDPADTEAASSLAGQRLQPIAPESGEQVRHAGAEVGSWRDQLTEPAVQMPPGQRSFAETILSQWHALDEQFAALRPALDLPDAAVIPIVSTIFADETEEEDAADRSRRRGQQHSDDHPSGEQQASAEHDEAGEQHPQEDGQMDVEPVAEGRHDDAPAGMSAEAERANDLYWRMAGWS